MKERPILFSGPMVRALLGDLKTNTRRVMKPQPEERAHWAADMACALHEDHYGNPIGTHTCPYGRPGDRLWVREALVERDGAWFYEADGAPVQLPENDPRFPAMIAWAHHKEASRCNSIHMPRWASRVTLQITQIRVERLHDLTEEAARAEGVTLEPRPGTLNGEPATLHPITHRQAFIWLWDQLNNTGPVKKRVPWASNPWVWVIEFWRRVESEEGNKR